MIKFQITLITVLMGCIIFLSCERAQQMGGPMLPDKDAMEPTDIVKPDNMIGMDDATMTGPSVVINELMADNDATIADPQEDYDDWLELYNLTDSAVMLTGMYLSDKEDNPTKWEFPENTEIPANGYLIVWLDEDHDDEDATEGLHANFKLSKGGEIVMLVGSDAEGNQVLDSITFGDQETDVAFGRLPDGTGEFQIVQATPGTPNMAN
ncbi:MAG: lamin tail domain-containing protein [Candidatus Poribacteria bacterium]|nr:lamin tail domain-containing protein [Candidatus Poribacteria bacterium]